MLPCLPSAAALHVKACSTASCLQDLVADSDQATGPNLILQVEAFQRDPAVQRIMFCGHSLGGATAVLAYLWARCNPGPIASQQVSAHRTFSVTVACTVSPLGRSANASSAV